MSETVSIDEPAGGYIEILEYRNSARGHLMALEDKSAMEGYLEMMQGTTLKQKAYGILVSSKMRAETIEQLVSLPWREVVLRYFEEEMRTMPKIHALITILYVRAEVQLRFAWCMIGLTRGEYERTKALLLLALLDIYQSKPMRINMKGPVKLEPMKKIDEIRRFSNKELRLSKESMGALPKSSEYCGPIRKKSYSYVSGIIGMAYNPFLDEDIRDCFFDYEQAALLRFWTSRTATIRSAANQQNRLGLVLEEKVTALSAPKSDNRVEFGLGFSDELLSTSLMVVWELMKLSWFPSPNADSILRTTQDEQRELNSDCNLRDLNIIYNLMTTASKGNGEDKVELPGWEPEDWVKPASCLAEICGLEGHICGGLDCVNTLEKQHKHLMILIGTL